MISTDPGGEPLDLLELQLGYRRVRGDGPWVMANFVTTIDGATVVSGGSTAISDPDDKAMFRAIRAVPDFILVGASTVRAEDYGPVSLDEERRQARLSAGLEPAPHLVVASRSLDLDPMARVFSDPEHRVTILTDGTAPEDRVSQLTEVADVVRLHSTEASDLIHYLRMARVVLCEGGPSLMAQLVAADLVDEIAWTVAPLVVGGTAPRMAQGKGTSSPVDLRLDRVLYGDRSLFLRYVRP